MKFKKMLIRISYIIIALSSLIFSQSYFNRILGGDIQFGDARSMSLANTHVSTGISSSITAVNPARLSYLLGGKEGFSFDFQIMSNLLFERRSIGAFDTFGDYNVDTDYVSNQSSNFYNSLGFIMSGNQLQKSNFAIGFSFMPLASFNYIYEEEVRGKESFSDGELIGSKDPLIGFQRYQNKGEINLVSLGFGYSHAVPFNDGLVSFGYSINRVLKSKVEDSIMIIEYPNTLDYSVYTNLSNLEDMDHKSHTPYDTYETFSIEIPFPYSKKSSVIISVETDAMIKSDNYLEYSNSELSGLPYFLNYNADSDPSFNPEYNFVLKGVEFYKPKKMTFGLRLDNYRTLFVFEVDREFYNQQDENNYDNLLNDISHYRFAFEHRFKLGSSIRMGLLYKEPIINGFDPIAKLTLGSNKSFNKNLNLDFALSYYITDYKYDDIFPVLLPSTTLDCSIDCETVTESNLSISTTLKWKF
ncbi:MAG: hypothetical protein CMG66_05590 [Candidatus Marinimicrobia bacterium]|nr:hypothetical protein [Candidatus Neomarinimicrobiota bacterium]|tara:strand:- start:22044 stop:23456 length:1413 start_codon:yes stop_codon:yes gene_type:complete